jgi:hypothetical protein
VIDPANSINGSRTNQDLSEAQEVPKSVGSCVIGGGAIHFSEIRIALHPDLEMSNPHDADESDCGVHG